MIQFTKPIFLILLIPLGWWTWKLSTQSLSDLSRFRSRLALGLRLALVVMLVFALAGARMVRNVREQCVLFVVDVSDSIPKENQEAAKAYINESLKHMSGDQKAGVVVFGGESSVEMAPSNARRLEKIYSVPSRSNTDIAQAISLALAVFPEESAKRIVLLSDGNETRGKALEQALLANSEDVSIDVVPTTNELPHEVLLEKMIVPSAAKVGEPFDLKLVAVAKEPTSARVRIFRNGSPVNGREVELAKGKSILTFQQSMDKAGNYEFRAILDSQVDTRPENNVALGNTMVKGKPKVLYVEGEPEQATYLANALRGSEIEVEARDKAGIPTSMPALRGYDMVVLSDVPAWSMAPEQMEMLRSGVKDLGIGLTMIGGENGFGAGGYFDTPVEKALPVDMSIKKQKVLPSLSVVIVMDKSGSMGAPEGGKTKIELANDAAAAVVRLLQPIDKVGVIVCHDTPVTAVDLQSAANKQPIYDQIATIRAEGGGIVVYASMVAANKMISGSNTRQKHVILLADGADCDQQEGTVDLVKDMARRKITVTAVAIGDGPHVPFLKAVAASGKGQYYLAQRASDLKAIFTKDVMTVSKSLVVEEPFLPQMDPSAPELDGIDPGGVPPLLGYVSTTPKGSARVSMISHQKDPVLATWQYGLGRSAAFTPDCKARWSARWVGWQGYRKFWAQVLRSTMRKSASTDFQTVVNVEGGRGYVTIDAVDEKGNFLNMLKFSGSVVGPDMKGRSLGIEQTGPGRYEGAFDASEVGSYLVNIVRKDQPQSAPEITVVNIPYPPEYMDIAPNTGLLEHLSSETGGVVNPKPEEVFSREFRSTRTYTDLWRLLALLSAVLLPLDVAVRRLVMGPELLAEVWARLRERARARRAALRRARRQSESLEAVSTLLESKRERKTADKPTEETERFFTGGRAPTPERTPPPKAPAQPEPESDESVTSRLLDAKRRAGKQK